MSVDVKVTRWVSESAWTTALQHLFERLIYNAAEIAADYAPVDMGKLKQSLNPQSAGTVDGGAWPAWARFGPKGDAATYGGYLNAGSYVRTWVPPLGAIVGWGIRKGMQPIEYAGIWNGMYTRGRNPKTVYYHYVGGPAKAPMSAHQDQYGQRTQGWFNPSVIEAMERGPTQEAADKFAAEIERAWNGK